MEEIKTTTEEKRIDWGKVLNEITQPFIDLFHASRALWGINLSYMLEGITYFGVVGYLVIYFNDFVKLDDINAGQMVGIQTAGITLAMLFLGATVDWIGVRKSLMISLVFMLIGRTFLCLGPNMSSSSGMWSTTHMIAMLGILGIVLGYGIYQPACYAAVKQFTNEKTSAMGYAMLYALMNLGGFLPGIIAPPIRKAFPTEGAGILAVMWVYVGLTVAGIIVVAIILTKKTIKESTQTQISQNQDENGFKVFMETLKTKFNENKRKSYLYVALIILSFVAAIIKHFYAAGILNYYSAQTSWFDKIAYYVFNFNWFYIAGVLAICLILLIITDVRFVYFIFILIPVQTLFAHNWLTLPVYFKRAFTGVVQNNFEFFSNFNPILIFILTPMVAALTVRSNTYKMMIYGTLVMAFPTFILALGPSIYTVFGYLILMTIGEAMWQPRFLQWVAEIAPKGMTGIYMGIGQFPWFLTKVVTSLYSGWFLMHYAPEGAAPAQMNTETMWLIYGFIAILSPLGLWLSKGWMMKGFKVKYEE